MQFDWYRATIDAPGDVVLSALCEDLGAVVRRAWGGQGYAEGAELVIGHAVCARVLYGGSNLRPSAWASGENTSPFVDAVRGRFEDRHTVSRLDSAEDFDGPGTWRRLYRAGLAVGRAMQLQTNEYRSPTSERDGRTLYLGARSSESRVCIYEKGKQQLRVCPPEFAAQISPDWVRVELRMCPEGSYREYAARCTPVAVWGMTSVSRRAAKGILRAATPFIAPRVRDMSDDESALRAMCRQYGNILKRKAQFLGSPDALGRDLMRRIQGVANENQSEG